MKICYTQYVVVKKTGKGGGTAQSLSDDIVYYQTAYQRHIFL